MKFCQKCGTSLNEESKFCYNCGTPAGSLLKSDASSLKESLLLKLSERVKTNGTIWIVIASIQILCGLFLNWTFLIVGVLNIISAIRDINYCKEILTSPKDIVKNAEPLVIPIITLIYNLIFGGIIGVAGSIYYLIAVRGFIMENKNSFLL